MRITALNDLATADANRTKAWHCSCYIWYEDTAMFLSGGRLHHSTVRTIDSKEGILETLYVDISKWVVRYLVTAVNNGGSMRWALISPISVIDSRRGEKAVCVNLTHRQIWNSPDVDFRKPVGRELEVRINAYYKLGEYWSGTGNWGNTNRPQSLQRQNPQEANESSGSSCAPLISFKELCSYLLVTSRRKIGRIEDIMINQVNWKVGYIVIENAFRESRRHLLLNPEEFVRVQWRGGAYEPHLPHEAVVCLKKTKTGEF